MAHVTSPIGFRVGKTFLWSNNNVSLKRQKLDILDEQGLTLVHGLEKTINMFLMKNNYFNVQLKVKRDLRQGNFVVRVLYYPLITPLYRTRLFPTQLLYRNLIGRTNTYTNEFGTTLKTLLNMKRYDFLNRFIKIKPRKQLNKWLTRRIFRGSSVYRKKRILLFAKQKLNVNKLVYYKVKKNSKQNWRLSSLRFDNKLLELIIYTRLGLRVRVFSVNIFNYLIKKYGKLSYKLHQEHFWERNYARYKNKFSVYYDIVNGFYILKYMNVEYLILELAKYGLHDMHRRNIKPKRFFYFIDSIIKHMTILREEFSVCRLLITGKLRGGTARTTSYSAGYGVLPRQSLDNNIRMTFTNIESHYGSFGVKFLTLRKNNKNETKQALS